MNNAKKIMIAVIVIVVVLGIGIAVMTNWNTWLTGGISAVGDMMGVEAGALASAFTTAGK